MSPHWPCAHRLCMIILFKILESRYKKESVQCFSKLLLYPTATGVLKSVSQYVCHTTNVKVNECQWFYRYLEKSVDHNENFQQHILHQIFIKTKVTAVDIFQLGPKIHTEQLNLFNFLEWLLTLVCHSAVRREWERNLTQILTICSRFQSAQTSKIAPFHFS